MAKGDTLQFARASSAWLTENNPILKEGEPIKEQDSGKFKVGDGRTRWNNLDYILSESDVIARIEEIVSARIGGIIQGPGGSSYVHTQSEPSASWIITHNLGQPRTPVVLLDAEPTRQVLTDVHHSLGNLVTTIDFPSPVTGRAYL